MMTALFWMLGVTLYLAAYGMIGWQIARWDLPDLWQRERQRGRTEAQVKREVQLIAFWTAVFWPFRWPWLLVEHNIDRYDPKKIEQEHQARIAARDLRITELERENRVGPWGRTMR